MKVLKILGLVLGAMALFVLGIFTECFIRSFARKPIPVVREGDVRAEVAAYVQPDFLWAGEAWCIEVSSDTAVVVDLDGKWSAVIPPGTNTIHSNHDVNNTAKLGSNLWWKTPSRITVKEVQPQPVGRGKAR